MSDLWDKLLHFFGVRCGFSLIKKSGKYYAQFNCRVCAMRAVAEEIWEGVRIAELREGKP